MATAQMHPGKPATAAPEAKKAEKAKGPKDTRPCPTTKDKEGKLLKLRRKDFPKTRDGKMAFCDYQVSRWLARKESFSKNADPNAKAIKKLEAYKRKMAELEKQLADAGVKT